MWNRYRYNYPVQIAIATILAAALFMVVLVIVVSEKTRSPHIRSTPGRCRPESEGTVAAHYYHDRVYWTITWPRVEFRTGNTSEICHNLTTPWLTATKQFNASAVPHETCWAHRGRNCTATLYNPNTYRNPDGDSHRRTWFGLYALAAPVGGVALAAAAYILWDDYRCRIAAARQADYQNISSGDLYAS